MRATKTNSYKRKHYDEVIFYRNYLKIFGGSDMEVVYNINDIMRCIIMKSHHEIFARIISMVSSSTVKVFYLYYNLLLWVCANKSCELGHKCLFWSFS